MNESLVLTTRSADETELLGRLFCGIVPYGSVVALYGDLAAGKTCFIRGMAERFAGTGVVHSPTFTLVNEYGASPKLYHLDLYRLSEDEVADLGYEELFEPDGITAVEWAERAQRVLPPRRLEALLEHGGEDRRRICITDRGVMPEGWADELCRVFRESAG